MLSIWRDGTWGERKPSAVAGRRHPLYGHFCWKVPPHDPAKQDFKTCPDSAKIKGQKYWYLIVNFLVIPQTNTSATKGRPPPSTGSYAYLTPHFRLSCSGWRDADLLALKLCPCGSKAHLFQLKEYSDCAIAVQKINWTTVHHGSEGVLTVQVVATYAICQVSLHSGKQVTTLSVAIP